MNITINKAVLERALEWFEWFHSRPMGAIVLSSTQVANMLREALAQPQPVRHSVPSGYVLVPIRPTQEILDVFDSEDWTWLDLLAAASEAGDIFAAHKPHPVHEHAVWNKAIRDSVDSLLDQAGYQPDSSARHQLAMMNFDTSPQQPPPPPPECKTEAERTAYAFGWFKALETVQKKKEVK